MSGPLIIEIYPPENEYGMQRQYRYYIEHKGAEYRIEFNTARFPFAEPDIPWIANACISVKALSEAQEARDRVDIAKGMLDYIKTDKKLDQVRIETSSEAAQSDGAWVSASFGSNIHPNGWRLAGANAITIHTICELAHVSMPRELCSAVLGKLCELQGNEQALGYKNKIALLKEEVARMRRAKEGDARYIQELLNDLKIAKEAKPSASSRVKRSGSEKGAVNER
jgi:hypothetical protein